MNCTHDFDGIDADGQDQLACAAGETREGAVADGRDVERGRVPQGGRATRHCARRGPRGRLLRRHDDVDHRCARRNGGARRAARTRAPADGAADAFAPAGRHCGFVVGIDQTAAEIAIANKRFRVPGRVEFEVRRNVFPHPGGA